MKVFVSYASDDLPIAQAFCRELSNAFKGDIEAIYAKDFLKPGTEWKKSIRERLSDSDALVSILTQKSINRPWIYIEWSAFWMSEKSTFLIIENDLEISKIIDPMRDIQIARMSDIDQIKALLANLSKMAGVDTIPYGYSEIIVQSLKSAQIEVAARTMDAYLDPSKGLPKSDAEKFKVAEYFLETEHYRDLRRVCGEIRDDAYIFQICSDLINEGADDVVGDIASLMKRPARIASLAEILVERKQHETVLFSDLLERIGEDDQNTLTSLFKVAFRDNVSRERIFSLFFRHFHNLPEIRKISVYLADLQEDTNERMREILKMFRGANYAELRKLMEILREKGKQSHSYYLEMLEILKTEAPRQFDLLSRANDGDAET